jgi:imidazolonepropionase-like amidohydrolase
LSGGIAHIGNGQIIENSTIIIDNGKIVAIGPSESIIINKKRAQLYDVTGKHVYPSLILPNTTLGLVEIDAVRATRDHREAGQINPNVRTQTAYNTESIVVSTVRTNGILLAQITPRGGLIAGTSSIMKLDGWNWEDATYYKDDGIHINWPEKYYKDYWGHSHNFTAGVESEHEDDSKETIAYIDTLVQFFNEARQYQLLSDKKIDLKLESLKDVFEGKKKLYIHVNGVIGMKEAVMFAKKNNINDVVLVGASESWRITDFLVKNNVEIILGRVHSLPTYIDDDIDQYYKTPKILKDAGIVFCLDYHGDMERMGGRNLPFLAGTTVAYGLSKEEALELITLNTAKILEIDDRTGSLEVGKDANLFISTGDALDIITNNIEFIFLMGKPLSIENHQTKLNEKYLLKYNLK